MAVHDDHTRFGSARFASRAEIARAGMFRQRPESLFCGYVDGKPLWYGGAAGALIQAGARSGKLTQFLGPNLFYGVLPKTSIIMLDIKGEGAAVSQNQTPDRKYCIYWNPTAMHGLAQHRINPVGFLNKNNPSLVADAQSLAENLCPRSDSPQGAYFELRAQSYLSAIILALVAKNDVLTLPDLYRAVSLIPGGGDAWLDVAYDMHSSGFELAYTVEEEIAASRDDTSGGFKGIIGEMLKALSALADPQLQAALSPPFDLSFDQLCNGAQRYQVYLMPPAESIQTWAPILRSFFVGAMIEKARRPDAPRQVWIIDEAGQIGHFPLLIKLFTLGAGLGITPVAVFQSSEQMNGLGANGRAILTSSAGLQISFAARDIEDATRLSKMLGVQTLSYDNRLKQSEADVIRRELMNGMIEGADPFAMSARLNHLRGASLHQAKERRPLYTPDEVMSAPEREAFMFVDGVQYPLRVERQHYFNHRLWAGRYHPNPFHPPTGKVRVQTRLGKRWRRVVTQSVPRRFAHYPQYQSGLWSRIER